MVYDFFDKFTFLCDFYIEEADKIIKVVLHFFPFDNSVQVIDASREKILLRRVHLPSLKKEMLQIGNIVNVFSKLLFITDCASATKRSLFKNVTSTFALIKPIPASEHGKIITYISKKGFRIVQMKNGRINKEFAIKMYGSIKDNKMLPQVVDYVTGDEVIGLELVAENAVEYWRSCLGVTDPLKAAEGTLRKLFGKSILYNVAHGCTSSKEANEMLQFFFGKTNGVLNVPYRATFKDCACCVIKPHALIDGNFGAILEHISKSNFTVTAMALFTVALRNAYEFFEVYKGVVPEYEAMSIHLAEGKCVALEVKSLNSSLNVVTEFRKLCGPRDPDVARQLYPDTIRALYGKDTVHNAVHCTDLPEDGELEVEYFFKLIGQEM